MFAAFTQARTEYKETIKPRVDQWANAQSIDQHLSQKKGHLHPVPDIPPHPGMLGESKDPSNWADNLGTERLKNGRR